MECLYLSVAPKGKICRQMIEQGLDGELDDFDVTHYCKGNPNYCFFFRFYNNRTQVEGQPEENEPNAPVVPITSFVLNESIQPDEPDEPSKQSDKLLKLKRFLHRIT